VSSRDEILRALRATTPRAVPLPDIPAMGIRFDDPVARFLQALPEVGGAAVRIPSRDALESELEKLPAYRDARKIASCIPGLTRANVDLSSITDPHQLADVDFAMLPGELGVAESGAVWVLESKIHPRAVAFIAQNIAVLLSADSIVHNLHEAYERIQMPARGFGMWLSGPSKTADIEQALVIGAHGARTCTAFVVG
jgi:L-lactate dehydrogenase complex protein LldG